MSEIAVATSGSIDRNDVCAACECPMLYRVDGVGRVTESFCENPDCALFLVENPE